jgi:hypothetical protein
MRNCKTPDRALPPDHADSSHLLVSAKLEGNEDAMSKFFWQGLSAVLREHGMGFCHQGFDK